MSTNRWSTDDADHDCRHQNVKIREDGEDVCTVWIDDAPVEDYNAKQRRRVAFIIRACNAHDDLVAALKAALLELTEAETHNYGNPVFVQGCRKVAAQARAALAKVTP